MVISLPVSRPDLADPALTAHVDAVRERRSS
jgi:hypothetical protein